MKAAVEVGEILEATIDIAHEFPVLGTHRFELRPVLRISRQYGEGPRRAQFEHLADFEELEGETGREALETPAGIWPFFDQSEMLEAVQKLADDRRCNTKTARQIQLADQRARRGIIP